MELLSESREIQELAGAGELDEAVSRCLVLTRDFSGEADVTVRRAVFDALVACIRPLLRANRGDDALRLIEEVRSLFGADDDPTVRTAVVSVFGAEAKVWMVLKDMSKAVASLDQAWSLVASCDALGRNGAGIQVLLDRATVLHSLGRDEEGIVVLDAVMAAIRNATSAKENRRSQLALVAAMFKLEDLMALDRGHDARALAAQFTDVLREISPEVSADVSDAFDASESALAEALAHELRDHNAWSELQAGRSAVPAAELAQRAVRLYQLAEPWAMSSAMGSETPADVAATTLRNFADGYAILTATWTPAERARLPLARRPESGALLGLFGVEDWAIEQGHPLGVWCFSGVLSAPDGRFQG